FPQYLEQRKRDAPTTQEDHLHHAVSGSGARRESDPHLHYTVSKIDMHTGLPNHLHFRRSASPIEHPLAKRMKLDHAHGFGEHQRERGMNGVEGIGGDGVTGEAGGSTSWSSSSSHQPQSLTQMQTLMRRDVNETVPRQSVSPPISTPGTLPSTPTSPMTALSEPAGPRAPAASSGLVTETGDPRQGYEGAVGQGEKQHQHQGTRAREISPPSTLERSTSGGLYYYSSQPQHQNNQTVERGSTGDESAPSTQPWYDTPRASPRSDPWIGEVKTAQPFGRNTTQSPQLTHMHPNQQQQQHYQDSLTKMTTTPVTEQQQQQQEQQRTLDCRQVSSPIPGGSLGHPSINIIQNIQQRGGLAPGVVGTSGLGDVPVRSYAYGGLVGAVTTGAGTVAGRSAGVMSPPVELVPASTTASSSIYPYQHQTYQSMQGGDVASQQRNGLQYPIVNMTRSASDDARSRMMSEYAGISGSAALSSPRTAAMRMIPPRGNHNGLGSVVNTQAALSTTGVAVATVGAATGVRMFASAAPTTSPLCAVGVPVAVNGGFGMSPFNITTTLAGRSPQMNGRAASAPNFPIPPMHPHTMFTPFSRKPGRPPTVPPRPAIPPSSNPLANYLTTCAWDEEKTRVYQMEVNGTVLTRRVDNGMVNGTKLLNIAGLSRGKRDGILKNERPRQVVKNGPMHLKGVCNILSETPERFLLPDQHAGLLLPTTTHTAYSGYPPATTTVTVNGIQKNVSKALGRSASVGAAPINGVRRGSSPAVTSVATTSSATPASEAPISRQSSGSGVNGDLAVTSISSPSISTSYGGYSIAQNSNGLLALTAAAAASTLPSPTSAVITTTPNPLPMGKLTQPSHSNLNENSGKSGDGSVWSSRPQ
ncbi:hypothetical protein HK102_001608, partial [Quaeritorhiza haematococci]